MPDRIAPSPLDVSIYSDNELREACRKATARERRRPLVLVWRDERNNEICRTTPLTRGATRIAIPLDASHADLLDGDGDAC